MAEYKCLVRLQGESEWEEVENWRKVDREVLVQVYLEDHPEFYSNSIAVDNYKKVIVEVKGINEEDFALQTYSVEIEYKYNVKRL